MTLRAVLTNLGRLIKFVVIGSVVVTRSSSGAMTPEEGLDHELAWMAVRQGLDRPSEIGLTADMIRLVGDSTGGDLEMRVRASYSSASAATIPQLDTLWMESLMQSGAGSDVTDRFLEARSSMLAELLPTASSAREARDLDRVFKRTPYDAGA